MTKSCRRIDRIVFGTLVLTLLIGCEPKRKSRVSPSDWKSPPVVSVEADDREMAAVMQRARESFPDFWKEVSIEHWKRIRALQAAMVLAYLADPDAPTGGEHLWVRRIDFKDGSISGLLASSPQRVKSVKPGQTVSFPIERVSDWFYVLNGKIVGAFTIRLLRERMTFEERAAYDRGYPFSF